MRLLTGDELGWRLASLADGEGSFFISQDPRKPTMACGFTVGMRSDDRAYLELMQASTGLGILYDFDPSPAALERRPGTKPQTHWRVTRQADCVALVALFDKYPPLSKKGRDYAIWREGVAAWQQLDRGRMQELRRELMAGRSYVPLDAEPPAFVPDPQLTMEALA